MTRSPRAKSIRAQPTQSSLLTVARVPLAVCVLALLVYSRSLFCGFIRDDGPQIVRNPQVQSWEYLPHVLTSPLWNQMGPRQALFYRPLFSLWMLLVHSFGGFSPWFWHLSSILLHVACTSLVFRLSLRLIGNELTAGLAAGVFAMYPIHVDAVSWLSASNELLFSFLILNALLVLLAPGEDGAGPRILASAGLYFMALFAKETGISMALALIALAWIVLRDQSERLKRAALAAAPFAATTGVYLLIRWSVMQRVGVESGEHTWRQVIFSSPSILLFYLQKLLLPVGLSGEYVNAIYTSPRVGFWLPLTAIVFLAALLAWLAARVDRGFGIAAALIFLPLLPALAAVRIYPQGDMTHDRYLYLPSVGLCLLGGMVAQRWLSDSRILRSAWAGVFAIVIVLFSVMTLMQQRFYQDDIAYLQRAIAVNPRNGYSYASLGNVYMDQGNSELALKNYRTAAEIDPDDGKIALFLARGLYAAQQYTEAESVLKRLTSRSDFDLHRRNTVRLSLANVEITLGRLNYAEQLLQQTEEADPSFPELHWAFGVLYQREGHLRQAQGEYQKEYQLTGDEAAQRQSAILLRQLASPTTPPQ
jgi:protein O-mannosyl-transferase